MRPFLILTILVCLVTAGCGEKPEHAEPPQLNAAADSESVEPTLTPDGLDSTVMTEAAPANSTKSKRRWQRQPISTKRINKNITTSVQLDIKLPAVPAKTNQSSGLAKNALTEADLTEEQRQSRELAKQVLDAEAELAAQRQRKKKQSSSGRYGESQ